MKDPSSASGGVDERVLDDLWRRFTGFDAPAQPITPADIGATQLRRFGLPPRPGPAAPGILHRVWERGFGKTLALRTFAFDPVVRRRIETTPYRISAQRANRVSATASPFDTSRNWAGAYLTANGGRKFAQIWGPGKRLKRCASRPRRTRGRPACPMRAPTGSGSTGSAGILTRRCHRSAPSPCCTRMER